MPATYTNGFGGSVVFAGYTLEVVEWTLSVENGLIDVTNTASSNYGQFISGVNVGTADIKSYWDTTVVQTGATANLLPGTTGTGVLKVGNTGKSITCSLIIMKVEVANSPTAGVQFNFSCKVTSAPTFPS